MSDAFTSVLGTVLAAVGTATLAALVQFLSQRQRSLGKRSEETARSIALMVQRRDAERRSDLINRIVEKLPNGMTAEQFLASLEPVAAKLATVAQPTVAEASAVESLVSSYHEQALDQAKVQFWFSVVAATVGFGWILYTGAQIETKDLVTVTKTLPGVAIDAVAFLFFKQAAETRQRATELYDRLRNDRKSTESIALVAGIEDLRVRSAVKAQIALHMAGLAPEPINLSSFLSVETRDVH